MKKTQVRLDRDLAAGLESLLGISQATDKTATESVLVRVLLREALAARKGKLVGASEQGYREGWLRGYGDAQQTAQLAFHAGAPSRRSA